MQPLIPILGILGAFHWFGDFYIQSYAWKGWMGLNKYNNAKAMRAHIITYAMIMMVGASIASYLFTHFDLMNVLIFVWH